MPNTTSRIGTMDRFSVSKKFPTVKIHVSGGVAYVMDTAGVTVEITDYDVDPASPQHDEHGVPCARWAVEGRA